MIDAPVILSVATRAFERILDVTFAGMAIWFGFRLYDKAGTELSDVVASKGQWLFKLRKVGPGTLFALFGCVTIGYSLVYPVVTSSETKVQRPGDGSEGGSVRTFYGRGQIDQSKTANQPTATIINAITEVAHFQALRRYPSSDSEVSDYNTAIENLKQLRGSLVQQAYSPEDWAKWLDWSPKVAKNPNFLATLSPADQATYNAIAGAMDVH